MGERIKTAAGLLLLAALPALAYIADAAYWRHAQQPVAACRDYWHAARRDMRLFMRCPVGGTGGA